MASLGHVVAGLAVGRVHDRFASPSRSRRQRITAAAAFAIFALLPDLDVVGFRFGVDYASPFGHRGALHSLLAAVVIGLAAAPLLAKELRAPLAATAACTIAAVISHGLLDTLTDGGLGVALLWPFSEERFFAPWQPIPVAPIGRAFLSLRGLYCAVVEVALFSPLLVYAVFARSKPRPVS
jgi:inner membrane protein